MRPLEGWGGGMESGYEDQKYYVRDPTLVPKYRTRAPTTWDDITNLNEL